MINISAYQKWIDSLEDDLKVMIQTLFGADEAQIPLIVAHNNCFVALYDLIGACNKVGLMYSWPIAPQRLLDNLDTLVVTPELKPTLDDLKADYQEYLGLVEERRAARPANPLNKEQDIRIWWIVHDSGWDQGQSEEESVARLNVLLKRSKEAWAKEPPSQELDRILAYFEPKKATAGVCPKCGSGQIKLNGKDRHGKQRFKCKDCNTRY
jgi:hypothetical protein